MAFLRCFYRINENVYFVYARCNRRFTPDYGMYRAYNCRRNEAKNTKAVLFSEYVPYGDPILLTETMLSNGENLNECCLNCIYCYDTDTRARLEVNPDAKFQWPYCDFHLGYSPDHSFMMIPHCRYRCSVYPNRSIIQKSDIEFRNMFQKIAASSERFEIPTNTCFISPNALDVLVSRLNLNDQIYFGTGNLITETGQRFHCETANEYLELTGEDVDSICFFAEEASKELYCSLICDENESIYRVLCIPKLELAVFSYDESVGISPFGYGHMVFAPKETAELMIKIEEDEIADLPPYATTH